MKTNRLFLLSVLCGGLTLAAQSAVYNSGSTGADGAFNPIITGINPTDLSGVPAGCTWTNLSGVTNITVPLNASGIYNFTAVSVPANYRIRFLPNANNTPVVWLATGDITIGGEISVGAPDTQAALGSTNVTLPGPGGFAGGVNGPGSGPYGGIAQSWGYNLSYGFGSAAPLSLPLVGGSGGALSSSLQNGWTVGRGGGGVLYLASSSKIVFVSPGVTPNGIIVSGAPPVQNAFINAGQGWSYVAGGGDGAVALFANQIVGPVRASSLSRVLVAAASQDTAPVGKRIWPFILSGVNLSAVPSARIKTVAGIEMPVNPGSSIYPLPLAGTVPVEIVTTNLPLGISFTVGTSLLNQGNGGAIVGTMTNVNFAPTVAWTYANSGIASGNVTLADGNVFLISAIATAPVLVASAPIYDGSPVKEFQMAVDNQGQTTCKFVTTKGAVLSYEAAMSLAMQQGKWQFLLNPLAARI